MEHPRPDLVFRIVVVMKKEPVGFHNAPQMIPQCPNLVLIGCLKILIFRDYADGCLADLEGKSLVERFLRAEKPHDKVRISPNA